MLIAPHLLDVEVIEPCKFLATCDYLAAGDSIAEVAASIEANAAKGKPLLVSGLEESQRDRSG